MGDVVVLEGVVGRSVAVVGGDGDDADDEGERDDRRRRQPATPPGALDVRGAPVAGSPFRLSFGSRRCRYLNPQRMLACSDQLGVPLIASAATNQLSP